MGGRIVIPTTGETMRANQYEILEQARLGIVEREIGLGGSLHAKALQLLQGNTARAVGGVLP